MVSIRLTGVAGCSCATAATRAVRGISMLPPSGCNSPRISLNRVDLPTPLRPARPTLAVGGIATLAWSKKRRPQALKTRPSICSMDQASQRDLPLDFLPPLNGLGPPSLALCFLEVWGLPAASALGFQGF